MGNSVYKDAIARSFMELSKEKKVKDITVSDITSACGISRQTFYHHFKDKYAVIEYLHEPAVNMILEIAEGSASDIRSALLRMYQECYNNKEYYMSLLSYEGQNSFEEYTRNGNRNFYINFLKRKTGSDKLDKSLEIAIDFACHGAAFTLINWIRNGMKETPEYISEEMYKCHPEVLRKAMEN